MFPTEHEPTRYELLLIRSYTKSKLLKVSLGVIVFMLVASIVASLFFLLVGDVLVYMVASVLSFILPFLLIYILIHLFCYVHLDKVSEKVQLEHPEIPLDTVKRDWYVLGDVPEAVQLANPEIPLAAVKKHWYALKYVPEAVQLAHPEIPRAAVKKHWRALKHVPAALKTNVEVLAKLYTGTEEQLIVDLRLLGVEEGVIDKVANYYHRQIALSSDMIKECIAFPAPDCQQGIANKAQSDCKQGVCSDLLPLIGEYI